MIRILPLTQNQAPLFAMHSNNFVKYKFNFGLILQRRKSHTFTKKYINIYIILKYSLYETNFTKSAHTSVP